MLPKWEPAGSSMYVIAKQMKTGEANNQLLYIRSTASLFQNSLLIRMFLKAVFGILLLWFSVEKNYMLTRIFLGNATRLRACKQNFSNFLFFL